MAEIKIKIKSLAAEIAMIHDDERKYMRRYRQARARIRAIDGEHLSHRAIRAAVGGRIFVVMPSTHTGIPTVRDDIRGYVRDELVGAAVKAGTREQNVEIMDRNARDAGSLAGHRTGLRSEFRHALLAYAFLRGRPYASCEVAGTRTAPDWDRIGEIAERFSRGPTGDLAAWVRAGKRHLGLHAPDPVPSPPGTQEVPGLSRGHAFAASLAKVRVGHG